MIVNSKAAVSRIPVGTRLRCVYNAHGPCDSGRIVEKASKTNLCMRIDDPNHPHHGERSWLTLKPGETVEARDYGFVVIIPAGPHNDEKRCEYRFEEV